MAQGFLVTPKADPSGRLDAPKVNTPLDHHPSPWDIWKGGHGVLGAQYKEVRVLGGILHRLRSIF